MILESCVTKIVTFKAQTPRKRDEPKAIVLHTNGAPAGLNGSLFAFYSAQAAVSTQVAHVQVTEEGVAEQYADTTLILGLSWDANDFSVGIESEDGGKPSTTPWTAAQIEAFVDIAFEMGVPARELPENGAGGGIGYHQKYASWNQSGHDCPGSVRRAQVPAVISALAARYAGDKEDEEMAVTKDDYEQRAFQWGQKERWQKHARPTKSPNLDPNKPDENYLGAAQAGWDKADNDPGVPALSP